MPRLLLTDTGYAEAQGSYVLASDEQDADADLREQIASLRQQQAELHKWTRYGTYATIAGVLFAAARTGIIWLPLISKKKRRRK